jgi:hypothetical protein
MSLKLLVAADMMSLQLNQEMLTAKQIGETPPRLTRGRPIFAQDRLADLPISAPGEDDKAKMVIAEVLPCQLGLTFGIVQLGIRDQAAEIGESPLIFNQQREVKPPFQREFGADDRLNPPSRPAMTNWIMPYTPSWSLNAIECPAAGATNCWGEQAPSRKL